MKVRLDLLLCERGLFPSREQARAAIMAGEVLVDEQKADKAGSQYLRDAPIRLIGDRLPYVSRGGLKLARAIEAFGLYLRGKTIIDLGASTGGFTDCALQHGAAKVYAVDVGYGQLAWKLRQDERVVVLEKCNARYVDENIIPGAADMITADLSFISLTLALPSALAKLLNDNGEVVALIKPQFEARRDQVGKKGVVRNKQVHEQVIERILAACAAWELGVGGIIHSPLTGPQGNIEYLLYGQKGAPSLPITAAAVVQAAWIEHKK